MSSGYKRVKSSESIVGPKAIDNVYNDVAGANKTITHIVGKLKNLGSLSSAKSVDIGKLVAIYNDSATTGWVKTGPTNTITAPTGGADGIACRPYDYTIIAVGTHNWVIGSAGTLWAYELDDESSYISSAS